MVIRGANAASRAIALRPDGLLPYRTSEQCWQSERSLGMAMACERCGCRMVIRARAGHGGLVCTDCGHPADPLLHGDRMRRAWLGVVGLLMIALVGGLIYTLALFQEAGQLPPPRPESGGQERSE